MVIEEHMKRITSALITLALGLLSVYSVAADFWDKKPYTEWREKDCEKLLKKSPWARPYAISRVTVQGVMNTSGGTTRTRSFGDGDLGVATGDTEVNLYLQIRFVTAKPVKAAVGRLRILADPNNQAMAQQVEQYVNQPSGRDIVVEVTYYSEPAGHPSLRQLENFLRAATLPSLKDRAYLSASKKGVHLPIGRYQAPQEGYNGAILVFPRYDDEGVPHFDGSEKEILFHMETNVGDVDLKLKPKDMVFEEEFTL
jgi:hypothetical protein